MLIILSRFSLILLLFFSSLTMAEEESEDVSDAVIKLQSNIIGDKEQPSVSYFIPWKGTDSPDALRWQVERKNDDTLDIVDRKIMLRSMTIYNGMGFESGAN